jgi:hypothetical protein
MSTMVRLMEVIKRVAYPGFEFTVFMRPTSVPSYYLQISCADACNETGDQIVWKSRKWLLSEHMTDGEIVQTAFKATLAAIEHETRERFTYRDVSVFDPHYDIEKLVELRQSAGALKGRDDA